MSLFFLNSCQIDHNPPFLEESFSFSLYQEEEIKYQLKEDLSSRFNRYYSLPIVDITKALAIFNSDCLSFLESAKIAYEDLFNQLIVSTGDLGAQEIIKTPLRNLNSTFFNIQKEMKTYQEVFSQDKIWQEIQLQEIIWRQNNSYWQKEWQFHIDRYRENFSAYIDKNKILIDQSIELFSKKFLQTFNELKPLYLSK